MIILWSFLTIFKASNIFWAEIGLSPKPNQPGWVKLVEITDTHSSKLLASKRKLRLIVQKEKC